MKSIHILPAALVLMSFFLTVLPAQEKNFFIYPQPVPFQTFKSSAGLSLADLPEDQVEEASTFIRGPLFNFQALYGLPENFQIYGAAYTNFVTFHFSLGPRWQFHMDRFALALGYDIAYWIGELNHFGYNSKVKGWIHYPGLTIGYDFADFSASLKTELILQTARTDKSDDVEIRTDLNTFTGMTISPRSLNTRTGSPSVRPRFWASAALSWIAWGISSLSQGTVSNWALARRLACLVTSCSGYLSARGSLLLSQVSI